MNQKLTVEVQQGVTKIMSTAHIYASKKEVWDVLKFPGNIAAFHPLIKRSFMTTQAESGLHAKRHCDLLPMGAMDEVITDWKEGKTFTMEVIGGKMLPPHHFMKGRIFMREVGEHTEVSFELSYRLKFGVIGRLLDRLLIQPQFKNAPTKYVQGLKKYVEGNKN